MLPTLLDEFGITSPVYFRKIPSLGRWNPESSDLDDRVKKIVDGIFTEDIYSLWRIDSNEDFYGVVAAISAGRTPRDQNIDFIWFTEEEIGELRISQEQTKEGKCLSVEHLHYNALTQTILEYQQKKGCKAVIDNSEQCICEQVSQFA